MKNTTFRFRCIPNPKVIYTPEFLFDVEAMRKHPEYVEIDAEGNEIKQFEEEQGFKTIPLNTAPKRAEKKPVGRPRKG